MYNFSEIVQFSLLAMLESYNFLIRISHNSYNSVTKNTSVVYVFLAFGIFSPNLILKAQSAVMVTLNSYIFTLLFCIYFPNSLPSTASFPWPNRVSFSCPVH